MKILRITNEIEAKLPEHAQADTHYTRKIDATVGEFMLRGFGVMNYHPELKIITLQRSTKKVKKLNQQLKLGANHE